MASYRVALGRLALMLGPFVLGVVLAEWYASTTPDGNAAYFIEDPELTVVRKPGIDGYTVGNARWIPVHINREGLRDDELPSMRDPAESWVLCIGDSFTFGGGVETNEAWPQRLQAIVGTPESSKFRVLNGGANGWDTPWQRLYLEKRGLPRLKPAIVVLGFNWNDLEISIDAPQQAVDNFILCKGIPQLEWCARFAWIRETHLFRLAYSRVRKSAYVPTDQDLKNWTAEYRAKRERDAITPERKVAEIRKRRFKDGKPDEAFWLATDTKDWKIVREEMKKIRDLCAAQNTKFLVAMLPEPTWNGPGVFPGAERMIALLDAIGVPYVDVEPAFLERDKDGRLNGQGQGLWLRYDPFHPTPKGQQIFADVIAGKLRELHWIP